METVAVKKPFFDRGYFPVVVAILFSLIFTLLYMYGAKSALLSSGIANNANLANIFATYGLLVGPALGLVSMVGLYLLFLIKLLFGLRRFTLLNPFVYMIVYGGLFWLGYFLAYFEPRYTDIGRGIIDHFSRPLMYASGAIIGFSSLWLIYLIIRKISGKK